MTRTLAALAIIATAGLTACTSVGGTTTLSTSGIATDGEPGKSNLQITPDGTITGSSAGIAPSGVLQDAAGTYYGSSGPFGTLTVNPDTGQVFITSPNDGEIEIAELDFQRNPTSDTLTLVASDVRIKFNITDNLAQQRLTYAEAVDLITSVAVEQRLETVQQLEAAGAITATVAAQLAQALFAGGL